MARVLIVEHDAQVRRTLGRVLARAGHEVSASGDAERALTLTEAHTFDAAVIDHELPGMSGLDLLIRLEAHQPRCVRVLVTAHLDLPLAVEAVNKGHVSRVIRKPFGGREMLDAIDSGREAGRQARNRVRSAHDPGLRREAQMLSRFLSSAAFGLALQPIVDPTLDEPIGFEGLMRGAHPLLTQPRHILGIAERHSMLSEVGVAVTRRAEQWLGRLPHEQRMFLNLHPDELADMRGLARRLEPLMPWRERVVLEVTAACTERWPGTLGARLRHIRKLGFSLALDDLGTGRSALSLLAESNPAYIKTDLAIVRGIDQSPRKQRLLDMLCSFADATDADIIAEGVETQAEADTLRRCGVTLMQGYLFGRPSLELPTPHAPTSPRRAAQRPCA